MSAEQVSSGTSNNNILQNGDEKNAGTSNMAVDTSSADSATHATAPREPYTEGFKLALLLISVTTAYFLMTLDQTILATAIPYITNDFQSLLDVGWYISAYQLANAALQPLSGKMYAQLNMKWTFLGFFIVFEVGSAICGAANTSVILIVGRAIAGMGSSGLMNGSLTILGNAVVPEKQPGLLGMVIALSQLGIALGPVVGGAFTQYVSWRWCFYINLPLAALVVPALLLMHIPEQTAKPKWTTVFRRPIQEFDLVGFAIFAPSAIMFFLALQYGGNQFAWNSSTVIGLFVGAGVTFLVWLGWDWWMGEASMVPLSIMRNRIVWASCTMWLFLCGTIFIHGYYLPIYFQTVRGASPLMSGVYVLPNILPQMLFAMICGKSIEYAGYYLPFIIVGNVLNSIASGLLSLLDTDTPTAQWVGYQILLGAARGISLPMGILAIQNALPPQLIPIAMSVFVFAQNFGGAVMIVFGQTIFTNSLRELLPVYAPTIDPDLVIKIGAGAIRDMLPDAVLPGVLLSYSESIQRILYLGAGCGVAALIFSPFMGWIDIRKVKQPTEKNGAADAGEGKEPLPHAV